VRFFESNSYLPQAAFLLHVFLDVVPDAALGEEVAAGGQLKLLVAAVSLQGELHDALGLRERRTPPCERCTRPTPDVLTPAVVVDSLDMQHLPTWP